MFGPAVLGALVDAQWRTWRIECSTVQVLRSFLVVCTYVRQCRNIECALEDARRELAVTGRGRSAFKGHHSL